MATICDGCGSTECLEKYSLSFVGVEGHGLTESEQVIVQKTLDLCPTCDEKLNRDLNQLLKFENPLPTETKENLELDHEGKCKPCQSYFVSLGRICTSLMASECDCPKCSGLCQCEDPEGPVLPRIVKRPRELGA